MIHKSQKKRFWAVAAEIRNRHGKWHSVIEYIHADIMGQARFGFAADHCRDHYRIVAIGEALGYFVEDEHGEKLRA